jgi:phospholipid/cholesterol/gamma-HCH transport system substrate-binding protein
MDERVLRFRIGVMVLATILIVIILAILFEGWPSYFNPTYNLQFKFSDAPGVTENTPIKKSGILIGRVTKVQLIEEGGALVFAKIDADKTIRNNELGRITTSLLGDSIIHIVDSGRRDANREPVADGATLDGIAYDDPVQIVAKLQDRLSVAIGSIAKTSDELGQVAHQVSELLDTNKFKINALIANADEASVMLKDTIRGINDITGDPKVKGRLLDALDQVPQLIRETRDTVGQMGNTMTLVDKNLKNLDRFTNSLGDVGQEAIAKLGKSAEKLDGLLAEILTITKTINNGDGTLSQLIHDPKLYDNINRTVTNVEELTRRARPIVDDVRVFTDSIARHPEKLGVRGAIDRSQGTKW